MHQALLVERVQAGGHLPRQRQRRVRRNSALPLHHGGQGFAVDQLHGEVKAIVVAADVEDAADVGVRHLARQFGLLAEALQRVFGGAQAVVANGLQGYRNAQLLVGGFVHFPHPAGADEAENTKAAAQNVSHPQSVR